jgi:hypothetical protein
LLLGLLAVAPACAPSAGSGQLADDGETGRVGLALQIAPGVSLSSAGYSISGPNSFSSSGTVNVGQTSDVPVVLTGLPIGVGYTLAVNGTASDGIAVCTGSAPFNVSASMMSTVVVHLVCRQPPVAGGVNIAGTTNVCPVLDGLSASPSAARVGGVIQLAAIDHDTDGGPMPLALTWSSSDGSLSGSAATQPFTCPSIGVFTITAVVSDGEHACDDTLALTVTCTAP